MQRATLIPYCGWDFNCTRVRKFWVNVPLASLIQPLRTDVLWSKEAFNMFSHVVHVGMALRCEGGRHHTKKEMVPQGVSHTACGHLPWFLHFITWPPGNHSLPVCLIWLPSITYPQKVVMGLPFRRVGSSVFKGLRNFFFLKKQIYECLSGLEHVGMV